MQEISRSKVCSGRNGRVFTTVFTRPTPKKVAGAVSAYYEFEHKLAQLADAVHGLVKIANGLRDGRIVSLENESKVADLLLDQFPWVLGKAENRAKGDLYVVTSDGIFPVNIKLIGGNHMTAKNNICGPVHNAGQLLFGREIQSKIELAEAMRDEPFTTTTQQYGVLAVNKTTGASDHFTLFNILDLYVNPTNAFQFSMGDIAIVNRTQAEGQAFIYDKVVEFFAKQAAPYTILNDA